MQEWIARETRIADFGDERLNDRYAVLLDRLREQPTLSIPALCCDATVARIRAEPVVIVAQDTSELEFDRPVERVGGPHH